MPAETPVTTPDTDPMLATDAALLTHTPPALASEREQPVPSHKAAGPAMAAIAGLTTAVINAEQPVGSV